MTGKQRNIRKKRDRDEEDAEEHQQQGDDGEVQRLQLQDLKAAQKLRRRAAGVDAGALAAGAGGAQGADAAEAADNELMDTYVKAQGVKSNLADEETHMQQFVERELAKRLGKDINEGAQQLSKAELDELELYAVPEQLKSALTKEVSIPGLITAITEVEVSQEAKMRKIEETEAMKARLLARSMGRTAEGGDAAEQKVRRGALPFNFGKKQQQMRPGGADADPEHEQRLPKYISERVSFPKAGLSLKKSR